MEQENFESIQSRRNKLRIMLQPQQPPNSFIFNSLTTPSKSSCSIYEYPSSAPCNDSLITNLVPMDPLNSYASILKGSKFLKPAQQLLEEFCVVSAVLDSYPSPLEGLRENEHKKDQITVAGGKNATQIKLVCMLEEVYNKYTLYCQQMQSAIASFKKATGLENSTPYISFGVKNISKHFGCLKHAIYDQLHFTNKNYSATFHLNSNSVQPILKSHRGLPDHAAVLLRKWLFEHFLHPYPTDSEKDKLAQMTGLSRSQVSNWFINARVRIWKPMVEEMNVICNQQAQPKS